MKIRHHLNENLKSFVLLVILIVAVVTVGSLLRLEHRVSRQNEMRYQLQALRTAVTLFKSVERRNPENLQELASAHFQFPNESQSRRFLDGVSVMPGGQIFDPFGRPYLYDNVSGWVRSQTPEYIDW